MRKYREALAFAESERKNPSRNWTNSCQMFARSCVGAAAWAPSAREAFNATPAANRHMGQPPAGALVYYGVPDRGFGHAVFSAGNGLVYSTDIKRPGKVDIVPYLVFESAWGLPYRGWIDTTPSGPLDIVTPVVNPAHIAKVPPFPGKFGLGAKGDHVKAIQLGLRIKVDGIFGPVTKAAVVTFQKKRPWLWPADGVVGPRTYKALAKPV